MVQGKKVARVTREQGHANRAERVQFRARLGIAPETGHSDHVGSMEMSIEALQVGIRWTLTAMRFAAEFGQAEKEGHSEIQCRVR